MKFDIKTDKTKPHHYIIAVEIFPATAGKKAGQYNLKYKPIHFTNDDVDSMQHAAMLSVDKLFKTSDADAIEAVGLTELAKMLTMVRTASTVNQCTLHHFCCEYEVDQDTFEMLVKSANVSKSGRDLLRNSILGGKKNGNY